MVCNIITMLGNEILPYADDKKVLIPLLKNSHEYPHIPYKESLFTLMVQQRQYNMFMTNTDTI